MRDQKFSSEFAQIWIILLKICIKLQSNHFLNVCITIIMEILKEAKNEP